MKLYFAGGLPKGVNIDVPSLISFVDKNSIYKYWKENNNKKIFLDSGAFSVFTGRAKINVEDYANFIKENRDKIEVYANLDVIGNHEATQKNQAYLEGLGLHPLYTFHFGSPLEILKQAITKYDYIALGGLVPHSKKRKRLENWLDKCFSIIKTDCKVHGFGLTSQWALEKYPFYSVDSTSWIKFSAFRTVINMSNGRLTNFRKFDKKINHYHKVERAFLEQQDISKNNIKEYKKLEEYITKLWKARGVNWD